MSPSRPFILRPVATSLFMLAIVLCGLVGFHFLPLSALPEVDYPTIQVQTLYPGASPEVMSSTVTAPLEHQLGEMSGLQRMSSTSAAGASVITLQFNLQVTLDVAEQEVQAAINAAGSLLPVDLPAPPVYAKVNPADAPVLTLAITSQTLPLTEVRNLVETRLAQKISQIGGVGLVSLSGGQRPAIRIQADTRRLASIGLSLDQLRTTITNANANGAKGSFDGPTRSYAINANDQLLTVDDYRNLIIANPDGEPVRLGDVADIVEGAENVKLGAWENTQPAIILNVQRQPGANVIATVDAIKARLPELQASLPAAIQVNVLTDRTLGIRASVRDVEFELVVAVALVVLVILLFLHSARATAVASLAVPISIIGTFGAMYLLGYSLNNLTLMALTIATGFVVDDAIVMIENISRYLENGETPLRAALKGAEQIGFTIISLTISLIAVLIPLLFMGDVVGRLFREFAVTLAITIVISAVVSLTLTASLSAQWLGSEPQSPIGAIGRRWQQAFDSVVVRYEQMLAWVLDRQRPVLIAAVLTLALTAVLYICIPKGLFPTQDTGQLQAEVRTRESVSFERMAQLQQSVAQAILKDPDVESLSSFIGVDGANTTAINRGRMLINLKPPGQRGSQRDIMDRLRNSAADVPGATLYLQPVQDLTIDAETGPTQYRLALEGYDADMVNQWAGRLVARLQGVPQLRNVTSDTATEGLATTIDIDRDSAARLGVSAATVDEALYSAFGQRIVSTIFSDTSQYRVILEAKPGVVTSPQDLDRVDVQTASGRPTPLTAIASVREHSAPLQINRVAQFPSATIGFDTAHGVSLGSAVDAIRHAGSEIGMPESIATTFLGAANAFQSSLSNELWLILAAIVCVYIVLGVLYESYIHPLTILSTLPSAGVGALLALLMTGSDLDVIGIIGIILLIGIVKKNAIMMIDFAIEAQRAGKSARAAIQEAALLRFRPILMTTFAALFAAVPLMLAFGEGSELRRPLGIAIFGGLIVSQLLTLFTTPVIYLTFDRLATRSRRQQAALPAAAGSSP
jgi:multidrug efflux pump